MCGGVSGGSEGQGAGAAAEPRAFSSEVCMRERGNVPAGRRSHRETLATAVKPLETEAEWTPCGAVETEQRGGLQVCGTGELLGESANEFSGHGSTTSN